MIKDMLEIRNNDPGYQICSKICCDSHWYQIRWRLVKMSLIIEVLPLLSFSVSLLGNIYCEYNISSCCFICNVPSATHDCLKSTLTVSFLASLSLLSRWLRKCSTPALDGVKSPPLLLAWVGTTGIWILKIFTEMQKFLWVLFSLSSLSYLS